MEEERTELSPKPGGNSGNKNDDEGEYESDPDEALPLTLRRREASDDEDGEEEVRERRHRRVVIGSDEDSEGQGRPAAYEEEEEADLEEEEEYEEEEEEEEQRRDGGQSTVQAVPAVSADAHDRGLVAQEKDSEERAEPDYEGKNQETTSAEEKKESEPYAVPTAGAFYMHDDRFRDSGGARHRRTPGGRKLWESKDDRAWIHDRFEEMNLKEEQFNEKRKSSRGQFRGRGRTRERAFDRGNRSRNFDETKSNKTLNQPQRIVKGRGPRRYEPMKSNIDAMSAHDKQPAKSHDAVANSGGGRSSSATPSSQTEPSPPKKHVSGSSLNSASPPFYPSGSSSQDTSATQRRDLQNGNAVKSTAISTPQDDVPMIPNFNMSARGKAVDPSGHDRLYADHPVLPVVGKTLPNARIHASGSSSSVIASQPPLQKVPERGFTVPGPMNYQFIQSSSPMQRVSLQSPVAVQQRTAQRQVHRSTQPLNQRAGGGLQEMSSASQVPSTTTLPEVAEVESPPGSGKSKSPPVGTGKFINQGSGKGTFLYGSAQVISAAGAASGGRGDQNFSPAPALLPVMQFGGQHHGGLGVPAVGMAFPGYVGQPQAGFGNSEMTWLPVLTGAAGASYAPYFALDGGYYAPTLGQTSSSGASRDSNPDRSTNTNKAPERPEVTNDEYGQRQNKPRRYSEMNFGQ